MSDEKITSVSATPPQTNQLPTLIGSNDRPRLKLLKIPLKQNNIKYRHGRTVNIYIVYELITSAINTCITYLVIHNCLFGAVKLIKNVDIDKYKYSGHGIRFDSRGDYAYPSGGYGRNVIIFGADLSSSSHPNNKTRSILVLGKDFMEGIDGTTIYAEKMYSTNFTVDNKKFCLSLHYNGDNSYLFVNGKEIIKFKAKDSEIVPYPLCLGNIPIDFDIGHMLKLG